MRANVNKRVENTYLKWFQKLLEVSKSERREREREKKRVIAQLLLLLFNCIEYNIELCPGLHNSHYITIDCCIRLYIRPIGTLPSIWRFQPSSLPSRIIIDVRPLTLYYTQSHYYYLLLYYCIEREFCETRDERKREREGRIAISQYWVSERTVPFHNLHFGLPVIFIRFFFLSFILILNCAISFFSSFLIN